VLAAGISAVSVSNRGSKAELIGRNHPIRIIVPRAPGGSVDIVGRGWSEGIHQLGGQSFVENIGGGGGRIGASVVAHAQPDGYTLLIGTTSETVLGPLVEGQSDNVIANLTPVGILSTSPLAICVVSFLSIYDLRGLVAYAKANPEKVNYGSAGTGTIGHVEGELLKQVTQLPSLTHVPYRGGSEAILDVVGGRLTFAIVSISASIVQMHRTGSLRVVAVTSPQRSKAAPDLADVVEQGYPALVAEFFIGLFAPADVPSAVLGALEVETNSIMQNPMLQATLLEAGFTVPETNRAAAKAYIQSERKRWKAVLDAAGLASK
jgi:tripartite-type tricarboxylate transporter receptor subunit TctC